MPTSHNFYTEHVSLSRVGQMVDFRVHNLTTTERNTLAAALGAAHEGLHVWDTDQKKQYYWNGTTFVAGVDTITGAMQYKGAHTSLTTAPAVPEIGYTYVFTGTAGTLTWAGQTFLPDAEIQPQDILIYRGDNIWDIVQGDDDYATETVEGNIRIASQALVNGGTNLTDAVVPATLQGFVNARGFAKTYFANGINTTALTPFRVTHGLSLQNKDSYVISVKDSSSQEITLSVTSFDTNSLDIISSIALSNLKVTVVGF